MDESIPPWELVGRLGEDEVVVVDCRSDEDWARMPVQIPGAVRMTCAEIREAPWALPDDELIVLYDGTSESYRPRMAAHVLRLAGRRALVLEGGLPDWLARGFPSEVQSRRPTDAERMGLSG